MKPALFALMASVLGVMWLNRSFVIEAYTEDDSPTEVRLTGVASLDFEKTSLPASPFVVHIAEDTRRRPMALLSTETARPVEVEMFGGETTIQGSVTVDGEPAAGGTVRLQRQVTGGMGVRDLPVNNDGWFSASDLPGGRYRVRAWLPGAATMTSSDVFFVESESTNRRSYELQRIQSEPIIEFADGGSMYVGLTGSFGASVTQHRVDNEGIVVTRPVSGAVISVRFAGYVQPLTPESQATNDEGLVVFRLRCRRAGQGSATVTFDERVIPVRLPACLASPPTTPPTSAAPQPDTNDAGSGDSDNSNGTATPTSTTRPTTTRAAQDNSGSTSTRDNGGQSGGGDGG